MVLIINLGFAVVYYERERRESSVLQNAPSGLLKKNQKVLENCPVLLLVIYLHYGFDVVCNRYQNYEYDIRSLLWCIDYFS